ILYFSSIILSILFSFLHPVKTVIKNTTKNLFIIIVVINYFTYLKLELIKSNQIAYPYQTVVSDSGVILYLLVFHELFACRNKGQYISQISYIDDKDADHWL